MAVVECSAFVVAPPKVSKVCDTSILHLEQAPSGTREVHAQKLSMCKSALDSIPLPFLCEQHRIQGKEDLRFAGHCFREWVFIF